MGYRYDHNGHLTDEKIKALEARIETLTDAITLDNSTETHRLIGTLQIKVAALKRNSQSEVMDWGVRIISNTKDKF